MHRSISQRFVKMLLQVCADPWGEAGWEEGMAQGHHFSSTMTWQFELKTLLLSELPLYVSPKRRKRKQESIGQQEKSHLFLGCKMSSFIREDSKASPKSKQQAGFTLVHQLTNFIGCLYLSFPFSFSFLFSFPFLFPFSYPFPSFLSFPVNI